MSDKLTDVQVAKLKTFVKKKDRYGYWNYLGNVVGVPYAKLALQVVTNEGRSGYIANKHAANRAKELGAVAAQWEADTARAQQIAGDPYAGLSEDNENFCTNTLTVSVCPSNFTKISHENGMLCVTNRLAEHLLNKAGNSVLQAEQA